MRLVASFLLCCVVLQAGAADIWRWKDADGTVHYSDQPRPGAERMAISLPAPSSTDAGQPAQPEPQGAPEEVQPREQPFAYKACTVSAPAPEETFRGVQPIDVQLQIDPELQPGHTVRVLYDGAPVAGWPPESTRYTLPEVFRGSHTLGVRILDADGRAVCAGPSISFYLQQASVLPPAGRARPAN